MVRGSVYTRRVGFYQGSSTPPPNEKGPGGFRETVTIIWVVFQVLAVPVGVLVGVVLGVVLLFYAFAFSPILGLTIVGAGIAALVGRGVWEARHPPELR